LRRNLVPMTAQTTTRADTIRLIEPPAATHRDLHLLGLIVLLAGAFLPMLDFFIVNVALPTIDRDLTASPAALELIVAGYGTAYTLFLVIGGRLGDAFGRRRIFMIGLFGFSITSLLCGIAPNIETLIGARVAQGISAALIPPQVLATFSATLAGHRRSRAVSLYAATGGIAVVIGQLFGGVLLHLDIAGTSWRPIFLVNVPIGLVGLLLAGRFVPNTRTPRPAGVDVPGTALLGVTIVALLIPLTEGRALGWPAWIWPVLALAPLAAIAMILVERRSETAGRTPLLPPSLLRVTAMRRGLPLAVPFFMGFGAFMFVFALTVQNGLHQDALHSGIAITPMAIGFFVGSLTVPQLVTRYGRSVLTTGMVLQAIGLATLIPVLLSAWPHLDLPAMTPSLFIAGIGQAFGLGGLFRLVLASVPEHFAGVGSGVLVTVQQGSLALGVASLGTLFEVIAEHGMAGAFVTVVTIQIAVAVIVSLASRRLPDPAQH
jgi:MFS family permease